MPHPIPNSIEDAAAQISNGQPPSFDFRRKHALNWDEIEMELVAIANRAMAVEMIGRTATENIHGEKLEEVFGFLACDIRGDIERLKELLGLRDRGEEVSP